MLLMLNSWALWWPEELSNSKGTFKGSFLLARCFLTSGRRHHWNLNLKKGYSLSRTSCIIQPKIGSWCSSFVFKAWGLAFLYIRAVQNINIKHLHKTVTSLFLPVLSPNDADFSFLLANVLCDNFFFFPQSRAHFICIQNLFKYLFFLLDYFPSETRELIQLLSLEEQKLFFLLSGKLFDPKLFRKLLNHPLLTFHSPASDHSPFFRFNFSYNGFTFSQIILESLGKLFLQQYSFQIAVFSIWDEKLFHKKCKFLVPAGVATAQF